MRERDKTLTVGEKIMIIDDGEMPDGVKAGSILRITSTYCGGYLIKVISGEFRYKRFSGRIGRWVRVL